MTMSTVIIALELTTILFKGLETVCYCSKVRFGCYN